MEITDWIAAISSVASLVVAVLATAIAWAVHRRDVKRLNNAESAAERAQADLITAWETAYRVSDVNEVPEGALDDSQKQDYGTYVYATSVVRTLVNRSNQPVYEVKINPEGATDVFSLDILPPGEQEVGFPRYAVTDYSKQQVNNNERLLNISFRDVAGNWWVREARGALKKVTSEEEHDSAMGATYQEGMRLYRKLKAD
ncbi:hypothetical protein M3D92_10620 [Micrococcus terreus]|uniref:hypothetical protein n=1 Tax=Micrococcus terreus TaxID=574650 RepID=UPI0021A4E9DB|nr:hypothetical protein [Micrococcus terreus]MCT2089737.1 hypothetical protein [Micrococcus terreus]